MKVLMLNPYFVKNFCRSARWAAKSRDRVQRHPDWMAIATAVLEEAGNNVKLLDAAAMDMDRDATIKEMEKFNAGLTVIHTTTPSIYNDIGYAKIAKDLGSITILIGPHVSAVPDNTFEIANRYNNCVDGIARGEYDYVLRDIADGKEFEKIEGISYRKKGTRGKIIHNKNREPLDVNELPFPAWKHIDPYKYHDGIKLFPFITLLSGRGCFGQCTFCRDTNVMYGRKPRLRNPKKIVDEIEYDYKLFPYLKEVMFETDTFTAVPYHTKQVCNEIIERGLDNKWSCNVRTDIKLELLPLMKKAGCRMLMIGFEFGTQKALDSVKKGITLEQSRKFAQYAHKLGFTLHGCFMIGSPGETRESAIATIKFAKSLPLDTVQFSGICTYPGTPLFSWAKEKGFLIPKDWTEWINENHEQVTLLNYPQLNKEEIDELIDLGLKKFYFNPNYIAKRFLRSLKSYDEMHRSVRGFKGLVNYFTSKD